MSYLFLGIVASAWGMSTEVPLNNLYDSVLLSTHGIIDASELEKIERAYRKQNEDQVSGAYSCFVCGVSVQDIESIHHYTNITSHVAYIDHLNNKTCFLSVLRMDAIETNERLFGASHYLIPPVLKIHHSIFDLFGDYNTRYRNMRRLQAGRPPISVKPTDFEKQALVIQLYPTATAATTANTTPTAAATEDRSNQVIFSFESLLAAWHSYPGDGTDPSKRFLLSDERTGGGTWHNIRTAIVNEEINKSNDHDKDPDHSCTLPLSSHVEYEGDFVRIVDLRDFTGSGAACLVRLVEVAAMDSRVLSVTVEERPVLLNYAARGVLQSGTAGYEPFAAAGLTGDGEVVGVADSGLNDLSCFFYDDSEHYSSPHVTRSTIAEYIIESDRRKVIQYVANADGKDDSLGHGTHVCGSIAGKSLKDPFSKANGAVPDAKIAFFDLQVSGSSHVTIPDLFQYVYSAGYEAGARVLSNSWGSSSSGGYTSRSYASDLFVYSRKDTLLIFAAGNSGAEEGDSSNFNPCISKNVLCVGSTNLRDDLSDSNEEQLEVSYFSSLGPTFDGRIKPDVVGPGFKIVSALSGETTTTDSTCGVTEIQGTSMAAPLVAGTAVIARQYFMSTLWTNKCRSGYDYCKPFNPSGYLLKGLLIHSCRAVSKYSHSIFDDKTDIKSMSLSSPPDFFQGYGQVTLTNVLPLDGHGDFDLYVLDEFSVSTEKIYSFAIQVTGSGPLKITLVWYDIPSTVGTTSKLLLNNLDLCLIDEKGIKWLGNDASASGEVDYLNPQEQIYIPNAEFGFYTVYVSASTLVANVDQVAALIITSKGYVVSGPETVSEVPSATPTSTVSVSTETNGKTTEYPIIHSKKFSFSKTLIPMTSTCLKSFNIQSDNFVLSSVELSIDGSKSSGTASFLMALLLTSPSGMLIQLGGYYRWYTNDNIWTRSWPMHWTGQRAGHTDSWTATRRLDVLDLQETGEWSLCMELIYPGWNATFFEGDITINFRKNLSSPSPAPTTAQPSVSLNPTVYTLRGQSSSGRSAAGMVTIGALLTGIAVATALLLIILISRLRKGVALMAANNRDVYNSAQLDVSSNTGGGEDSSSVGIHESSFSHSSYPSVSSAYIRGRHILNDFMIENNSGHNARLLRNMTPIIHRSGSAQPSPSPVSTSTFSSPST